MMVIFLVGLVSMILMRTLRKDYARYSKEEEMDDMVRFPRLSSLHWSALLLIADEDQDPEFPVCQLSLYLLFVAWSLPTSRQQ